MHLPILLMFLLSPVAGHRSSAPFNQASEAACPVVYVNCPDSCESDERPCTFTAAVKGARPGQKLSYSWEVSKGRIKTGQGTDAITIDLSGVAGKDRVGITAAVEVGGIGERCNGSASCTTAVY